MTDEERPHFSARLAVLAETFGEPLTAPRLEGYWLGLRDLPLVALTRAIELALIRARFFPRPAELRELAGAGPPDAGLVEALLLAHLRQPGGERRLPPEPFLCLVVERLGGLYACAGMGSSERLRALGNVLPAVVTAATMRGVALPTERAPTLHSVPALPNGGPPTSGGD